jgi:hypothetical protein
VLSADRSALLHKEVSWKAENERTLVWFATTDKGFRHLGSTGPEIPPRPTSAPNRKGVGLAAMIVGIVGVVLVRVPFVGMVLGVLATVFGGVGLNRAATGQASNRGSAITGLVLGIVCIPLNLIIWIGIANS